MEKTKDLLPPTTDEHTLLREFLTADVDLLQLADNHLLHIKQLIAWVDSPRVQAILADMQRIAMIRTNAILAQAQSAAATRLAQAAERDPERIDKKQITAHESARKAASHILRLTSTRGMATALRGYASTPDPSSNPQFPSTSHSHL